MKGYRISIIRHGMTAANEDGTYIGTTDYPLSKKGAAELAAKLDEFVYPTVHRVYTSPLMRCRETADILFPGTEIVPVEGMREMDFGDFENKTVDDLLKRDDFKEWLRGDGQVRPPNGESLEEMTARNYAALHDIIMDMMQSGITHAALITHAGVITNLLAGFGIPKYDPKYLEAMPGEGFDVMATAQMWLNSQAVEILGYCPYDKIPGEDE